MTCLPLRLFSGRSLLLNFQFRVNPAGGVQQRGPEAVPADSGHCLCSISSRLFCLSQSIWSLTSESEKCGFTARTSDTNLLPDAVGLSLDMKTIVLVSSRLGGPFCASAVAAQLISFSYLLRKSSACLIARVAACLPLLFGSYTQICSNSTSRIFSSSAVRRSASTSESNGP